MMLRLFATLLLALASSSRAFSPALPSLGSNAATAPFSSSCDCRLSSDSSSSKRTATELSYATVDGYHSSLSANEKLFSKLKSQVESLRSDISATKRKAASSAGPTQLYSFAGKKDYKAGRPWYNAGTFDDSSSPANGDVAPNDYASSYPFPNDSAASYPFPGTNGFVALNDSAASFDTSPANGVTLNDSAASSYSPANGATQSSFPGTSASVAASAAASGDDPTGLNGDDHRLESDLRAELQAVSAELQKVAAENEELKKMQAAHEQREKELHDQVAFQLAIYNRAEKELEQVKAQSLEQLELTNQAAAARLAAETAEFKARLFEAERMVCKMKRILEKVEDKLDVTLLDDSTRDYAVQTGAVSGDSSTRDDAVSGQTESSKTGTRWDKVKSTWGKVKNVFKSKEDDVNGGASSTESPPPGETHDYSMPMPAEPPFQVSQLLDNNKVSSKTYKYWQPMPADPAYQVSRVEKVAP